VGRTRSTIGRNRDYTRSGRAENNSLALRQILGHSLCSLSGLPLALSGRPQVSLCPTHPDFKKQNRKKLLFFSWRLKARLLNNSQTSTFLRYCACPPSHLPTPMMLLGIGGQVAGGMFVPKQSRFVRLAVK